jgi:Xaa-Pro aminopeptidase
MERFHLDLVRMRRERTAKLRAEMAVADLDACVLSGSGNVQYATGVSSLSSDPSRVVGEPTVAIVTQDEVRVFASYPEGVPPEVSASQVSGPLLVEFPEGATELAGHLGDLLGRGRVRVGFDDLTGAELVSMTKALPSMEMVDASTVLTPAKFVKTRDEIECIRGAQARNEIAMYDVLECLRPGVRQSELTGRFLERVFELGCATNSVDPIWQVTPPSVVQGPPTLHGDVAFPVPSTDQVIRPKDLIVVDTGIVHEGYCSDFGRTWYASDDRPSPRQREHFDRWCEVVRHVLAITKPGVSALELNLAARNGEPDRQPWLTHYYLIHGLGTQGSEAPFIGTDLGEPYESNIVLEPGVVMVLEPVIWDDGYGGYRAEEVLVVTDTGYEMLGSFPYTPFHDGQIQW